MDEMTPTDPTQPNDPNAVVADAADAEVAAGEPTTGRGRRFLNRTTGALVAVGLLGAVIGGGAVAVAGAVTKDDRGGYEQHDGRFDRDEMRDGPWGSRDGRSFGPGGGMMRGGPQGDQWGAQQGGPSSGQQQGGQQQFGPGGGSMQGGGWGPQGMTRGS